MDYLGLSNISETHDLVGSCFLLVSSFHTFQRNQESPLMDSFVSLVTLRHLEGHLGKGKRMILTFKIDRKCFKHKTKPEKSVAMDGPALKACR